jgi:hypothetical protein
MLEKLVAKAGSTVQSNRLTFKVGNSLFQNLWRKTPYSLFGSCRGWLDLQLSYSKLSQLLFKFLEKSSLKQCTSETFKPGASPCATSHASSCHSRAPVGLGVRARAAQGHRRPRHAPPHAPHPETPRSPPGASRAAPAEGAVLRRASCTVTTSSPERARLQKPSHPLSPRATALLHPAIASRRRARLPAPSPVRRTLLAHSLGAIEACAALHCSTLPFPRRKPQPSRVSPPAAAARPRRSLPRSSPALPRALGEHVFGPSANVHLL